MLGILLHTIFYSLSEPAFHPLITHSKPIAQGTKLLLGLWKLPLSLKWADSSTSSTPSTSQKTKAASSPWKCSWRESYCTPLLQHTLALVRTTAAGERGREAEGHTALCAVRHKQEPPRLQANGQSRSCTRWGLSRRQISYFLSRAHYFQLHITLTELISCLPVVRLHPGSTGRASNHLQNGVHTHKSPLGVMTVSWFYIYDKVSIIADSIYAQNMMTILSSPLFLPLCIPTKERLYVSWT